MNINYNCKSPPSPVCISVCISRSFFFYICILKLHHLLFPWYLNSKHTRAITTSEAHKPPLWHQWQSLTAISTVPTMTEGFLLKSWCHRVPGGRFVAFLLFSCIKPHFSVSLSFNSLEAVTWMNLLWLNQGCLNNLCDTKSDQAMRSVSSQTIIWWLIPVIVLPAWSKTSA